MIHRPNVPSTQKGQLDHNQSHTPLYKTVRLVNLHTMILSLSLVNARLVVNKVESLHQHLLERELDMCAITETWIKSSDDKNVTKEIPPPGYFIYSYLRQSGRQGGDLSRIYKNNVKVEDKTVDKIFTTLEYCNFTLMFVGTTVNLHMAYRIPSTSVIQVCDELTYILEDGINRDLGELLFVGDLNIHMDTPLHPDTTIFLEFMESFNLRIHTNVATHISNHYLDLALTEHGSTIKSKIDRGDLFSDHHFVDLKLAVSHPVPKLTIVKYRKLRGIDDELFSRDLAESLVEVHDPAGDGSSLVDGYNKSLVKYWTRMPQLKQRQSGKLIHSHGLLIH